MAALVTVGEFSRLTHLSVKTLHHYHEIGLLAPDLVESADDSLREETLRAHLERMERELAHTREVVTSLRELLTPGRPSIDVEYRFIPAFRAYGVRDRVERAGIGPWCEFALGRLGAI